MAEAPSFIATVYALVAQIPPGFVASYGQQARMLGAPPAAPGVHFHGKGRSGKRHLQRRFLRKRGAAEKSCDAVCLYSPSRFFVPP